jgi:hypothetical protein
VLKMGVPSTIIARYVGASTRSPFQSSSTYLQLTDNQPQRTRHSTRTNKQVRRASEAAEEHLHTGFIGQEARTVGAASGPLHQDVCTTKTMTRPHHQATMQLPRQAAPQACHTRHSEQASHPVARTAHTLQFDLTCWLGSASAAAALAEGSSFVPGRTE